MEEEMAKVNEDLKVAIKKLKKQNKKLLTTVDHMKSDLAVTAILIAGYLIIIRAKIRRNKFY